MPSVSRVFLRPLEEADLERTRRWHNDRDLYSTLLSPFRFVSTSSEQEWLRRKAAYSSTELNLAICIRRTGAHIGNIYLGDIDWVARTGALGIFIGSPKHRSNGYGYEAIRQLLTHAFADLNLNRIFLEVFVDNQPAIRLYEKCGFLVEGRLRSHAFKNGQHRDVLVMGLLKEHHKPSEPSGTKNANMARQSRRQGALAR